MKDSSLVIFSGGLDSTTCLYQALSEYQQVMALTFSYQQNHSIEIQVSQKICSLFDITKLKQKIFHLEVEKLLSSALISGKQINSNPNNIGKSIPNTYVPARNLIFLSIATGIAESHNISDIFIGVNAVDYSGYPDCRPNFIQKFQELVQLATKVGVQNSSDYTIKIHTPLIHLTKAEIIQKGRSLGVPYEHTWSCYNPQKQQSKYVPCQTCDSCILREQGFQQLLQKDPLLKKHGL